MFTELYSTILIVVFNINTPLFHLDIPWHTSKKEGNCNISNILNLECYEYKLGFRPINILTGCYRKWTLFIHFFIELHFVSNFIVSCLSMSLAITLRNASIVNIDQKRRRMYVSSGKISCWCQSVWNFNKKHSRLDELVYFCFC